MSKSILIIDDDDLVLQFAHLVLGQAGYLVSSARTAELGLATLAHAPASLLLLDINLPDMTGLKVLEILRRHRRSKTPVVMMTAKGDAATIGRALAAGANGYIVKPFTPKVLIDHVEAIINPRKLPPRTSIILD
jgi:two-component system OmpR family response regulator